MTKATRVRGALAIAVVTAVATLATVAAAEPADIRQRIAIEVRSHVISGRGTFTLIPLTPGPLARATGTVRGSGDIKPSTVRTNGQRVTVIVGTDTLRSARGTLRMAQRVESVDVGSSYGNDVGSWSIKSGTGAYADVRGAGALAGVALPNGTVLYRQEGYVSAPR